MISNYLYLFSIGIALITIIFIIYNFILIMKKKNESNTEKSIIKKYKNNLVIFIVILVSCISFIFYYSKPVTIYKAVDIGNNINYEDISVYGNITSSDIIKLDSEKGKEVFEILENYNYKRVFNFNDISGDVEFILFENTNGKPGIIEVWSTGYIRIPNNNLYKIDLENKTQIYSELKSIFMD
ncbi:hypothetical protein ACQPVP_02745 [Clostridium nigeriense]|uniref:hypothetical protein n=1 Tax=Clostridium nigeriense TaxID=1805470 RepID=UPI003D330F87